MDGLSIAASLSEIRPRIENGILRNVYQPSKTQFVLHTYARGNHRLLIELQDSRIHLTELGIENPASPSMSAMLLRKHLANARIEGIEQRGWDRVVTLRLRRREGTRETAYQLIVELIGVRANLHLVREGELIKSLRADGRNAPGKPYQPLPAQAKLDPEALSKEDILCALDQGTSPVAFLQTIDGVGKQTARDLLEGIGDDNVDAAMRLHERIRILLADVITPRPSLSRDGRRARFYRLDERLEGTSGDVETYQRALDLVDDHAEPPAAEKDPRSRGIERAIARRRRTLEKLQSWMDNASDADRMQHRADLLMIHQSEIPRGAGNAQVVDPATEETVEIRLDPSRTALENAQALYTRAKRIRRGHPHVTSRIRRIKRELRILEAARNAYDVGDEIPEDAVSLLPEAMQASRRAPAKTKKRDYIVEQFEGYQILRGRSAKQNDALRRAAAPSDLWLHAKEYAGAHVVVRKRGKAEVPASVLQRAAWLAATHSKGKGERRIEVLVTEARHVRKPRGAAPGLVNVRSADTLTVDMRKGDS